MGFDLSEWGDMERYLLHPDLRTGFLALAFYTGTPEKNPYLEDLATPNLPS